MEDTGWLFDTMDELIDCEYKELAKEHDMVENINNGVMMCKDYDEYMRTFDAVGIKNSIVEWIKSWFDANGKNCNAVVGISGGKDSSVVAALCVEALGKDRVIGVLMPNHMQSDIAAAYLLADTLGIMYTVQNIGTTVDEVISNINFHGLTTFDKEKTDNIKLSNQAKINLPSRIRMAILYAVSQSLNGRVANTCNLSEDWVGYSTRYGDSVGDFSPLSMLTTDEVVAVGKACGLPDALVEKVPSDGLCGKSDEDNLGFSYRVLNRYIRTGCCEDDNIKKVIDDLHIKNMFKLSPMPKFDYKVK